MNPLEAIAKELVADLKGYVDKAVGELRVELKQAMENSLNEVVEFSIPQAAEKAIKSCFEGVKSQADLVQEVIEAVSVDLASTISTEVTAGLAGFGKDIDAKVSETLEAVASSAADAAAAAASSEKKIDAAILSREEMAKGVADQLTDTLTAASKEEIDAGFKLLSEELGKQVADVAAASAENAEQLGKSVNEVVENLNEAIKNIPTPAPGRDAAHLEILPSIDVQKSYARGAYATHNGGLWRSYETTNGMRGWECIVEGIKSVTLESHSSREHTVKVALTGGSGQEFPLLVPAVEFKGQYESGAAYEKGDLVMWSGSLWHCNEKGTLEVPNTGDKWSLAAKRGRDGKTTVTAPIDSKTVKVKA